MLLNVTNTKKSILYIVGLVLLATGLVLNTKTGWGAAPIASLPYYFSMKTGIRYGNLTLIEYACLVIAQFIIKGHDRKLRDLLQIVYSLVFTQLLNLLSFIPSTGDLLSCKILYLAGANVLAGFGSAMILSTHWITNPADSFVAAIAARTNRDIGLIKNIVDLSFVLATVFCSLFFSHRIQGVGIGTIITIFGLGRVIWFYNRYIGSKIVL